MEREFDGFNTQPPKGGWPLAVNNLVAAACFNTQPPKGGWGCQRGVRPEYKRFNTQPPEGGWHGSSMAHWRSYVSTHSRLKAAGPKAWQPPTEEQVSTHSRLKAAGEQKRNGNGQIRGFNTQPPEGGWN